MMNGIKKHKIRSKDQGPKSGLVLILSQLKSRLAKNTPGAALTGMAMIGG